jgi:hydroxypyruvate isomerase
MLRNTNVLIDLFFTELPLDQRVPKVAALGYTAIETWEGGDAVVVKKIGDACIQNGVRFVSIVLNGPSDMTVAPVKTGNRKAFIEQLDRYSDNALAAGCHAGIVTTGNHVPGQPPAEHRKNLVDCMVEAGTKAAKKGFALNLEPLNTLVDHKGYYLESREISVEIVKEVHLSNVKLLYDLYHMQIMGGNHLDFILPNLGLIGHFHTAGVPGRHELFEGEMNYPFVMKKILAAGYQGFFGLEYKPSLPSEESLRKTAELLTLKPRP